MSNASGNARSDTSPNESSVGHSDASVLSDASTSMPSSSDGVKIICVGLMRTGHNTVRRALADLGYTQFYDQEDVTSSWPMWDGLIRNRTEGDPFPAIFQGAQVVLGLPIFCFWEQILERYPNARVILTVRNEDEWWSSVCRAKALMDSSLPGAPLQYGTTMRRLEKLFMPSYHRFCEVLRFAWATTLGVHALEGQSLCEVATRANFRKHNSYVQATLVKKRTKSGQRQLLVYDASDGWEPLCKFLGKEVPSSNFPFVKNVPLFLGKQLSQDATTVGMDRLIDCNQEIDELLVPDSHFGVCMRKELRFGLAVALGSLTVLVGTVLVGQRWLAYKMPMSLVSLAYIAFIVACWNAYVVMHGLVMRVPALVVLPLTIKSLLIAGALQACFITYGILKEQLVTQDKIASPVLILSARLMSVICGCASLLLTQGSLSIGGVPLYSFSAFGFTNEASTWAGYEMLRYVSFPVQVMAKSCNLLPTVVMGRVMNGTRYQWSEYIQAIGAMVCVAVMHFTDGSEHNSSEKAADNDYEPCEMWRMMLGLSLLTMFFACDSLTSQWQTAIYKANPKITQTQMMVAGNVVGCCITMCSIVLQWGLVQKSLLAVIAHPDVMGRVFLLGFSGAMGQFCIYTAIKELGPLSFTWIMTSRQLFTVLISLIIFGHGVSLAKLTCILTVFAIMSSKQLSRKMPEALKNWKAGGKARTPEEKLKKRS